MARIVPIRRNAQPTELGLRAMSRVPQLTDRWNLAWERKYAETGDATEAARYADEITGRRGNPFGTSFVEGIGTGTGLAIAAGVAGPFVVRRVRGALKKVGLKNPSREVVHYDGVEVHWQGNFAAWASDWPALYEMARRGEHGLRLDFGGPSTYGDVQVRKNPDEVDWYESGYVIGEQDRRSADAGLYIDPMDESTRRFEGMNSVAEQYHGYRKTEAARAKRRGPFMKGYYRAYGRHPRHPKSRRTRI